MTPEGKVKAKGRALVKAFGYYQFPVNQGGFGRTGIPDDVLCARGIFISIEYKARMRWHENTASARLSLPTLRQCVEMSAIRDAGGVPLVVDVDGLPLLQAVLEGLRDIRPFPELFHMLDNAPIRWRWTPKEYARFLKRDLDVSCTVVPAGHVPLPRVQDDSKKYSTGSPRVRVFANDEPVRAGNDSGKGKDAKKRPAVRRGKNAR